METKQPIITTAGNGDAALLTDLGITTFLETFAHNNKKEDMDKYIAGDMNLQQITLELADPANLFFLVWCGDVATGYAKIRTGSNKDEPANCKPLEIERIYVLQEYHSRKIGAALMTHCIQWAAERQYDTIWLGVWEHNYKAVNFYKKWGFDLYGSHIFRLGDDDQTDVLMKKSLAH